jgi:WD40 repeat protein
VAALAWRSDGKVFATGCYDNDIYLWDVSNPAQPLRTLKGVESEVLDSDAFELCGATRHGGREEWRVATAAECWFMLRARSAKFGVTHAARGTRNDENYYATLGRCRSTGHGRRRSAKVPRPRGGVGCLP